MTYKEMMYRYWLFVVAFIVGLVMVAPQLVFIAKAGHSYQGIYMFGSDAETHYLARMQEFLDTRSVGNPFLYEYGGSSLSPLFTFGEGLLTLPSFVIPISVPTLNLIYKFILSAIIFLLIYKLAYELTKHKFWSLVTAIAILFGHGLFSFSGIHGLLTWQNISSQFALYARPINPELSSIIFFAYLLAMWRSFVSPRLKYIIIQALLLAASFYVYFYLWTFLILVYILTILFWFWKKNLRYGVHMLISLVGAILLAIPALINLFQFYRLGQAGPVLGLLGLNTFFSWNISSFGVLAVLVLVSVLYKQKNANVRDYFLIILIFAAFISINQQLVTHIQIQEGHYHWYYNEPIFIIILLYYLFQWQKSFKWVVLAPIVLLIASIINVVSIQNSSYAFWEPTAINQQTSAPILKWLKEHTPNQSVVLADNNISTLVPIYTANKVYWNPYAVYYSLPVDTIEYRLFVYLKLNKYKSPLNDEVMKKDLIVMGQQNLDIETFIDNDILSIYPAGLAFRYSYFLNHFIGERNKFRLDYIVTNDNQNPAWDLSGFKWSLVFSNNGYNILKINP